MLAIDKKNNISGACTTSGLAWKMHGRVGDSPIIGAGLYIDNKVGGACATGVGESVMKMLGSFLIVELIRQGKTPQKACETAVKGFEDERAGLVLVFGEITTKAKIDYEKIVNDAKIEAKNIFSQTREKILRDINSKKEILEKEIDIEIKKAEKEILDLKKKSPEKINKIAIETSADLIKQIIGTEVNNSNISAIVEDVSKKNERKYYDN